MKAISQRQLRNDSGEVMRQVVAGASFRVTSRGEPIAILAPIDHSAVDELTLRDGSQRMTFPEGVRLTERTDDVLAELRGDR